jgi:hypothetical protein
LEISAGLLCSIPYPWVPQTGFLWLHPSALIESSSSPPWFYVVLPNEPALLGYTLGVQGVTPSTTCSHASNAIRVTIQP